MIPCPHSESRRARVGRWAGAAAIVCTVHVGGAGLALMQWPEQESEDAAGALMMELAPVLAVTPVDSPDIAHGPLVQEAMATPQAVRETVREVAKDLPLWSLHRPPSPRSPCRRLGPRQKRSPRKKRPRSRFPKSRSAEQASAAPLTTAPPRVEAQPAPSAAAPSPGQAPSIARAQASWQKRLIDHLNRHKRYPDAARSRRAQGIVVVAFRLDSAGRIVTSHVTKSSGSQALDEEALAVLQRASPLPAPPEQIAGPMLDLVLPIQFRIK